MLRKAIISETPFPFDGYEYNVSIYTSIDGGNNWWYCGIGKYAKTEEEAKEIVAEYHKQTVWHGIHEDEPIVWVK